jgi:hypothetical protein
MHALHLVYSLLLTCVPGSGHAVEHGVVAHPESAPDFSLRFPKGWHFDHPDVHTVRFWPPDADADPQKCTSHFHAKLVDMNAVPAGVSTQQYLEWALPASAVSMMTQAEMEEQVVGPVSTRESKSGLRFTGIRVDGQIKGRDWVLITEVFVARGNKPYMLSTFATVAATKRHLAAFQEILDAVRLQSAPADLRGH